MPINWSSMRVMEAVDMAEKHINAIVEPLECAREVAKAALEIPDLPQYMGQRFLLLLVEIDRTIGDSNHAGQLKTKLQSIRDYVPKDALDAEKKKNSYGEIQSLV